MYSTIGISGMDLLFLDEEQLELFSNNLHCISGKEVEVLNTELRHNKSIIRKLNLKKDTESDEYKELQDSVSSFKDRFFKKEIEVKEKVNNEIQDTKTNEFGDDISFDLDIDDILDNVANECISNAVKNEDLSEFFSMDFNNLPIRENIDIDVANNVWISLNNKFEQLPVNVDELKGKVKYQETLQVLKSLAKRIANTDFISRKILINGKTTTDLLDNPMKIRVENPAICKTLFKNRNENNRISSTDRLESDLIKIKNSIGLTDNNVKNKEINVNEDFLITIEKLLSNDSVRLKNLKRNKVYLNQLSSLYYLCDTINKIQDKEFSTEGLTIQNKINVSIELAKLFEITGYIPNKVDILINCDALISNNVIEQEIIPDNDRSKNVKKFLNVLALSILGQKYSFRSCK